MELSDLKCNEIVEFRSITHYESFLQGLGFTFGLRGPDIIFQFERFLSPKLDWTLIT